MTHSHAGIWFTAVEAAKHVKVNRRIIYRAVRRGKLRAVRVGKRGDLRFRPEWVDAWLEAGMISPVNGGK